ncbi:MAG: hypothetical protein U0746_05645 [Gemmataceae bacterium]
MPATTNKQRLLNQLFTALKKHYDPPEPSERPVLEQCVFAILREGATREEADLAFDRIQKQFFDWNEVRVSSPHEIEATLAGLPQPAAKAQRIVSLLQEVFESTYSFDLESLHKKGMKQAAKQVGRYEAATEFTVGWVTQNGLGGHAIPLDAPSLRTVRRLGLVEDGDGPAVAQASLEHQIPKAKGQQFGDLVSLIARDFCFEDSPNCGECPLHGDCATGSNAELQAAPSRKPKPR